jgi:hypothetical protein
MPAVGGEVAGAVGALGMAPPGGLSTYASGDSGGGVTFSRVRHRFLLHL